MCRPLQWTSGIDLQKDTKMILLLYLVAFFATGLTQELKVDVGCPTCFINNGTCYNVSHVLDLDAPFRNRVVIHKMGILRTENLLFYAFEPRIEDEEYFKIGFVNLENQNVAGVIASDKLILNFGTFDIDQDNAMIYLGGSDGIFVLDTNENKLSPYSSRGDTIKTLFFKNNVNFVKNEDRGIIVKKGDNFKTLLEDTLVKNFVINKYDVVVYLNSLGLFVGKGDIKFRISQNPFFRGLSMDLDGVVYAWWIDGIYKVLVEKNLEDSRIVKVVTLPSVGAVAFDNENNILFTVEKGLYKMMPSASGCKIIKNT